MNKNEKAMLDSLRHKPINTMSGKETTSYADLQFQSYEKLLNKTVGWLIEQLFPEEKCDSESDIIYRNDSYRLLLDVGNNFFKNISSFNLFEDTRDLESDFSLNDENIETLAMCIAHTSIAAFSFYKEKDDIGALRLRLEMEKLNEKMRERNEDKEIEYSRCSMNQ